ncbi:MAG: alpha/beta hydrolase [Armatimonadota bacterium]
MDLGMTTTPSYNFYTRNQIFDAIKAEADVHFAAAEARKASLKTAEEIRQYQREKRQLFFDALGGLPEEPVDLQPVVTGAIPKSGYRIEKVSFQSLPGFHVPALLYVPDQLPKERNAAVLFLCGHWPLSKACEEYQRMSQELARAGFVVLAMDPIGQGERQQYFQSGGYGRLGISVPEHSHVGVQCELAGSNLTRWYVRDMLCGVDYLASLPYVDPARIGATGNSGGGTQTVYLMLADERVAAAAPCTFINDRRLFLHGGMGHDAEQNLFRGISGGIDFDDMLITFAPRPALVGAARYDYFLLKGVDKCLTSARRIYRALGREDALALAVADTEHTYSPYLRKAVTNFFKQHLRGEAPDHPGFGNDELPLEPAESLNCCTTGNVVADFPAGKTVFQLNREYLQQRARRHVPDAAEVAEVLGIADKLPGRAATTHRIEMTSPMDQEFYQWNGIIRRRVEFFADDEQLLSGFYFQERRTEGTRPPLWLIVPEEGLADAAKVNSHVLNLVWSGCAAFVADVRGVGAGEQHLINMHPRLGSYGTEGMLSMNYQMLGRSLPGLRAYDVLRAVDCLVEMGGDVNTDDLRVHGYGLGALYALFAAVFEPRIKSGILEGMIPSFQEIVDTEYHTLACPERLLVHGILQHFDIPELLQLLAPREFAVRNPAVVGVKRPVSVTR